MNTRTRLVVTSEGGVDEEEHMVFVIVTVFSLWLSRATGIHDIKKKYNEIKQGHEHTQ